MKTKNTQRTVHLLGYASGVGGVTLECGNGPLALQQSADLNKLTSAETVLKWGAIVKPSAVLHSKESEVTNLCQALAANTSAVVKNKEFFIVFGGDHTSAIGTWSGVYDAMHEQGPLGLIWIDAHMDSHRPETSLSGRLHGMPLACLLGQGDARLTQILQLTPKIKPEHLCLIGIRSYEEAEAEFLKSLHVRIYFMDEVKQRGLAAVFNEALEIVNKGTVGYGISLDVDGIDPKEAPAVDVPEADGLAVNEVSQILTQAAEDSRLVGIEMVEFNPSKDTGRKTEKVVVQLVSAITGTA